MFEQIYNEIEVRNILKRLVQDINILTRSDNPSKEEIQKLRNLMDQGLTRLKEINFADRLANTLTNRWAN
jgi:hypothetical protein